MQCVNCLSKEAKLRGVRGWQWLWSPLVVELHCDRCLSNFYFPTIAWAAHRVMELYEDAAAPSEGGTERKPASGGGGARRVGWSAHTPRSDGGASPSGADAPDGSSPT